MPLYLVGLGLQVLLAVHAVRTGRTNPWLYILLIPGLGPVLYVVAVLLPEIAGSRAGRQLQQDAVRAVDPGRDYRALARQVEIAPSVQNRMQLAEECLRLGRAEEALRLYQSCATGLHAADPAVRLGLARARYETGDYPGTLTELEALGRDSPEHRTAEGHLLYARALEGAGRLEQAREEYEALVEYYPGEEARCRLADLLSLTGEAELARELYREIVRRVDLQGAAYRRAQRPWYDAARHETA